MEELTSHATAYSLDDEVDGPANRRTGERHITLFRVGSLVVGAHRHLCVVKNVSGRGASIRPYCQLARGQQVRLELKEQQPIEGEVIWVKGTEAGLEFKENVDVLGLLKVGSKGPRPRMPRLEVRASGFVRQGALLHRVTINNISQGGISAQCDADLHIGGEVTVRLAGLEPLPGVVRWGRSGSYGITFNSVLGLPVLVEWVQSQTERFAG